MCEDIEMKKLDIYLNHQTIDQVVEYVSDLIGEVYMLTSGWYMVEKDDLKLGLKKSFETGQNVFHEIDDFYRLYYTTEKPATSHQDQEWEKEFYRKVINKETVLSLEDFFDEDDILVVREYFDKIRRAKTTKGRKQKMRRALSQKAKMVIMKRDGYKCTDCSEVENLHVHHIVPIYKNGTNDPENLITLCHDCHWKKHRNR